MAPSVANSFNKLLIYPHMNSDSLYKTLSSFQTHIGREAEQFEERGIAQDAHEFLQVFRDVMDQNLLKRNKKAQKGVGVEVAKPSSSIITDLFQGE